MIPDGTYTAVVDEFEESAARLELQPQPPDDDGTLYELVVDRSQLPADGRAVGAVLEVAVVDEEPVSMAYDPDETQRRRETARERFDRLSRRPSEDE